MTDDIGQKIVHHPDASELHCLKCNGTGVSGPVFANYGYDEKVGGCRSGVLEATACGFCGGTGQWTEEQLGAHQRGIQLRRMRLDRGETLMEAAQRRGLTPAQISAEEQGRQD